MTQPAILVAIDPGETHVGIARFESRDDGRRWECVRTGEFDQPQAFRYLANSLWGGVDVVVYEVWQIYPHTAQSLVGSKCETAECIGVIKYLCSSYAGRTGLVSQGADIQTPTQAILRQRKMKSRAKADRTGPHAFSAELHGWCYLLQNGLVE